MTEAEKLKSLLDSARNLVSRLEMPSSHQPRGAVMAARLRLKSVIKQIETDLT